MLIDSNYALFGLLYLSSSWYHKNTPIALIKNWDFNNIILLYFSNIYYNWFYKLWTTIKEEDLVTILIKDQIFKMVYINKKL